MHLCNWIVDNRIVKIINKKMRKKLFKKGELPGWAMIVSLIIGLFVLIALIYIAIKSKDVLGEKIDFLIELF